MCEKFNITVKTTAAEAPWSNGLCERHNAVLGEMVLKTMADGISLDVALQWSIHAKNSLANVNGFSPYQLAIGYTPVIPNVLSSRPPALESSVESGSRDSLSKHFILYNTPQLNFNQISIFSAP